MLAFLLFFIRRQDVHNIDHAHLIQTIILLGILAMPLMSLTFLIVMAFTVITTLKKDPVKWITYHNQSIIISLLFRSKPLEAFLGVMCPLLSLIASFGNLFWVSEIYFGAKSDIRIISHRWRASWLSRQWNSFCSSWDSNFFQSSQSFPSSFFLLVSMMYSSLSTHGTELIPSKTFFRQHLKQLERTWENQQNIFSDSVIVIEWQRHLPMEVHPSRLLP